MNILILNSILRTAQNNLIPCVDSIKDCMIYNLCLGFCELGHEVTLVVAEEYKPQKEEKYDFEVVFISSIFKKKIPASVLPFQPALWRFLRENTFDLIISSEVFAFPSLFAAIITPHKTLIWHELAVHNRKMKGVPSYFWYNVIARLFFRKTPVVARSENARDFIKKYLPKVANETVEHGINLQKFDFSREKKRQFIIVSQLIPRKNIESMINKFTRFIAQKEFADFQLIIVGKGELENELKKQVREFEIGKNVNFVGFKPHSELNKLLAQSMALLIDTKQDNNMVSIPESVVCGTPVLTNFVPTNSETISRHHLGIAKKDWNESDLQEIVNNNVVYVENCIVFRDKLSTINTAKLLIDVYENPPLQ